MVFLYLGMRLFILTEKFAHSKKSQDLDFKCIQINYLCFFSVSKVFVTSCLIIELWVKYNLINHLGCFYMKYCI